MPCDRTRRPDGVYVTRLSGVQNLESLLANTREVSELVDDATEWFEIIGHEPDCLVTINYEEIQLLRVEVLKVFGGLERGAIALVAGSPNNYGAVRQFTLSMNDEPIPMAPFLGFEEANRWIFARVGGGVSSK
jgi:hypothetical protein